MAVLAISAGVGVKFSATSPWLKVEAVNGRTERFRVVGETRWRPCRSARFVRSERHQAAAETIGAKNTARAEWRKERKLAARRRGEERRKVMFGRTIAARVGRDGVPYAKRGSKQYAEVRATLHREASAEWKQFWNEVGHAVGNPERAVKATLRIARRKIQLKRWRPLIEEELQELSELFLDGLDYTLRHDSWLSRIWHWYDYDAEQYVLLAPNGRHAPPLHARHSKLEYVAVMLYQQRPPVTKRCQDTACNTRCPSSAKRCQKCRRLFVDLAAAAA